MGKPVKKVGGRKLHHCDGCGKNRKDVISCGRDANGDPDAPDLCYFCRNPTPAQVRRMERESFEAQQAEMLRNPPEQIEYEEDQPF